MTKCNISTARDYFLSLTQMYSELWKVFYVEAHEENNDI